MNFFKNNFSSIDKFLVISILASSIVLVACFFTTEIVKAAPAGGSNNIEFTNPLGDLETVDSVLTSILIRLRGIIATLSVVFIVIGGLLYITSAGNDSRMTMAKGAIFASVIGLAIAIAAPSFLLEIYTALGVSINNNEVKDALSIAQIIANVLNFLLGILGVISIIMLVAAGMMYLTAAGSDSRIETAKNMTKWSIIGIAVALSALIIVKQVASFFI